MARKSRKEPLMQGGGLCRGLQSLPHGGRFKTAPRNEVIRFCRAHRVQQDKRPGHVFGKGVIHRRTALPRPRFARRIQNSPIPPPGRETGALLRQNPTARNKVRAGSEWAATARIAMRRASRPAPSPHRRRSHARSIFKGRLGGAPPPPAQKPSPAIRPHSGH